MSTTLNPLLIPGSVVQRVSSSTSSIVSTSVAMNPFAQVTNTAGVEILTATITPKSATSILAIRFVSEMAMAAAQSMCSAIFIGSGVNSISTSFLCYTAAPSNAYYTNVNHCQVVSGTTSALIVRVRVGPSASTGYVNADYAGGPFGAGYMPAMLEVMEISA